MTKAVQCALGALLAVFAVGVQVAIDRAGVESPLVLAYPAILVAAWLGGPWAGVTAVLAEVVGLTYWVLPPTGSLLVTAERDALDLTLFVALSLVLVHLIARERRAFDEARGARAAAEAREAMVAVVAHDLRNPLQTIGMTVDLLATAPELGERARALLDRVRRSTSVASRLVDTVVDSARLREVVFPLELGEWPLSPIVDDSLAPFERVAASRSIRLDRPSALGGTVVCDRERVVQVLTSLLGKAFELTPRGGVVSVDVSRSCAGVRFRVTDTGGGMPPDELAHAFERLWQGDRPGHGSGLGLWIAEALVEAHGARINASSQEGAGTTMEFLIPPRRA